MNIDHKCKNSLVCSPATVCKQIETDSFYLSNDEQAEIYWQWLRNKYMRDEKRKYKNVFLKLPTNNPWIYAAEGGLEAEFPFKNNKLSNKKGEYQAAFRIIQQEEIKTENGQCAIIAKNNGKIFWKDFGWVNNSYDITAPVLSYSPNHFKLYNLAGNVEEYVAEKGITKGGGWKDTGYYLQNFVSQTYDSTEAVSCDRGFRVAMEILR